MNDLDQFKHLGVDFFRGLKYYRDYGENFQYTSLEFYEKCSYRCIYCITESQGKTKSIFDSKEEVIEQLDKEFSALDSSWVISTGAASDPYCNLEPELRYMRAAMELLKKHNLRFTVTTKGGNAILNDLDFYKSFEGYKHGDAYKHFKILISISTMDAEVAKRIEPGAPSPQERFKSLITLYEEGIPEVWLGIAPWIPGITDLDELFELAPAGMPIGIQPLEMGDEFNKPLDGKSKQYSAKAVYGKDWSFEEFNDLYVSECNRLHDKYIKKFPEMEWRWPIMRKTHANDRGYFRQLKPGMFKAGDFKLTSDEERLAEDKNKKIQMNNIES